VGRLVVADGGTVELLDAPEGGLAVVVTLPIASTPVPVPSASAGR
jgi:hypothetical protein